MEKLIQEFTILIGSISASIILLVAYFLISRLIRFIMYCSKDNNKDLIIKTINEKNKIDKPSTFPSCLLYIHRSLFNFNVYKFGNIKEICNLIKNL